MRLGVVYKVTCGRVFIIGSTIDPIGRKSSYFSKLSKNKWTNDLVQNAFNKYGKETFKFEILQDNIPEDILECVEDIWMGTSCAMISDNRDGANMKSANRPIFTKEIRQKMSEKCKGRGLGIPNGKKGEKRGPLP